MKDDRKLVKVAALQMACQGTASEMWTQTENAIRDAVAEGAQVVVTQELFLTPYFCDVQDPDRFDLAEAIPGETTGRLEALAGELGVVIVASLFERRAAGVYHNTAVVIDADGTTAGLYRKMHIPQDPAFEEKFYFTEGDTGFRAFDTRFGKIGVVICWDQWFPEAARATALQGAELIVVPTAIGWLANEGEEVGARQQAAWRRVQQGHAVANGCYWLAVNRVGVEGNTTFWGGSFLADFAGERIAQAGEAAETVMGTCDFTALEEHRRWWPFFRDRRIDAYGPLLKRMDDGDV